MILVCDSLVPPLTGYSGPLKEIPREKFNITVIPKSYCSPWREALRGNEELLTSMSPQLPEPEKLQPANYRCFNRYVANLPDTHRTGTYWDIHSTSKGKSNKLVYIYISTFDILQQEQANPLKDCLPETLRKTKLEIRID